MQRQTEGNPLFVQEIVRYMAESGLIRQNEGRWRRTGQTPLALEIPEGLRDVIGRRLSALSPECNRVLAVAAVIGREFDLDTLAAVAAVSEDVLEEALEEAIRVAVVEEQASRGVAHYRFAHALFRQTLYEEIRGPRRLRLHGQVARALEARNHTRLEDHAAELAAHFAQSTDLASLTKAVSYGEMAARRAQTVYAYGEAVRHWEQALEVQEVLDPDDRSQRCDLLLALGDALIASGESQRATEEIAERAFALAEAAGDRVRAAEACRVAWDGLNRYAAGQVQQASVYRQWAGRADRYALPETASRVHADLALALLVRRAGSKRRRCCSVPLGWLSRLSVRRSIWKRRCGLAKSLLPFPATEYPPGFWAGCCGRAPRCS
ncbi:MAG: hypothetical protein NTZ05_03170 [Chloroflexi bacterium]|nr:hypothetical protein [Chloroflexota bacterium]